MNIAGQIHSLIRYTVPVLVWWYGAGTHTIARSRGGLCVGGDWRDVACALLSSCTALGGDEQRSPDIGHTGEL